MKRKIGTKAVPSARGLSSKAQLLVHLRDEQGGFVSGSKIAKELEITRVAVWKTVQSLVEAGYAIEASEAGYRLDPKKEKDFLYPWEFGQKEALFYHFNQTESTMDRARELALKGVPSGTIITAEKQTAGRGRVGRSWVSRPGGLFFTILETPNLAIADYTLLSLNVQIAVTRSLTAICGKRAYLRWPNDVYINRQKIAGIITELSGEGDMISWLSCGVGVNVNNQTPSAKTTSCAEVLGRHISRREVLLRILEEIDNVKKTIATTAAYSQGNRALATEWNSLCDCIGAKVAVFESAESKEGRILSRGVFSGIDPAGRCILKTDNGDLYFNQGPVSLGFLNAEK
jgi:BirA family biotin operon repressor/biotin-[acetyl-CoA-carboxylase] ligase